MFEILLIQGFTVGISVVFKSVLSYAGLEVKKTAVYNTIFYQTGDRVLTPWHKE